MCHCAGAIEETCGTIPRESGHLAGGDDDFTDAVVMGIRDIEVGAVGGDSVGCFELCRRAGTIEKTGRAIARKGGHHAVPDDGSLGRILATPTAPTPASTEDKC